MNKRLIAILLTLVMLLCMSGCGNSQTQENPQNGNTEVTDNQEESSVPLISAELKEFLDSYESFMDEYCTFMKNYDSSDMSKLMDYMQILQKYTDFAEKANAWSDKELTDAETVYYLEVMNRVNAKLLEVVK